MNFYLNVLRNVLITVWVHVFDINKIMFYSYANSLIHYLYELATDLFLSWPEERER